MRFNKIIAGTGVALVLTLVAVGSPHVGTFAQSAQTDRTAAVAVGPQYDTTHVYVAPEQFRRLSCRACWPRSAAQLPNKGVFTVTPTPSSTMSQLVLTPVGTFRSSASRHPYPIRLEWSAPAIW